MNIKFNKATRLKEKPQGSLGFGKYFTDYMYVSNYVNGKWDDGVITPYEPLELAPATSVLHYGQSVFEGLKAYRRGDEIRLFRPKDNFARMRTSCERVCIPPVPEDAALEALKRLIEVEKDWIPQSDGESLYIRPFVFATDPTLGVHAAKTYKFVIILSPSGAYYAHGFAPVKLFTEREYVRAAVGGTGAYKVVGNYAASLLAAEKANALGYDQVLWLDAKEHKYVEEVGSMNIFFVINGVAVTPALNGSILPGVTRNSVISILKDDGISVEERRVSIDEVKEAARSGALTEIFGTGTAAVISPVDVVNIDGVDYKVSDGVGEISSRLFNELTDIQCGKTKDTRDWIINL